MNQTEHAYPGFSLWNYSRMRHNIHHHVNAAIHDTLWQNPSRDFHNIHRQSQRNNNLSKDWYWAGHPLSSDCNGLHNWNLADQSCENTQASGKRESSSPLTIFIMLPQFLLMGIADSFIEVGKLEFFSNQPPESMQSIGTAMFASTMGLGIS